MKSILLICAAGMSTSILTQKMQQAAQKKGLEVEIKATSSGDADKYIENKDIILLGPQVSHLEDEYKEKYSIPVKVIDSVNYGMMDGEKVLDEALQNIK